MGLLEEELARVAEQAAQTEDRLQDAMATLTLELEAVWRKHQAEVQSNSNHAATSLSLA